jgi:hypothetical protein
MCIFFASKIERPTNPEKIIMLKDKEFSKLGRENIISVIARERPEGLSKSYYYFVLNKLKELGLMKDNSINFKAVIPITDDYFHLRGILYITNERELIYINLEERGNNRCMNCVVKESCLSAVKVISKETKIKLRRENLMEAWEELIEEAWSKIVNPAVALNVSISQTDLLDVKADSK